MIFDFGELLTQSVGARYEAGHGTRYTIWAPDASAAAIQLVGARARELPLERGGRGYFSAVDPEGRPGDRYLVSLDGKEGLPDPASRFQPEGVFGPSQVVATEFAWTDNSWDGLDSSELTIYECHVGLYSNNGRFDGVIERLPMLKALGVTALELMPVAQFSGNRGWGYDGVFPFAAQNSYGGPEALKALVDACHASRIGVILDVVYNHLGPEGNVLPAFGAYFQERYHTPWGAALNFDGPDSDEVKRYFCLNLVQWLGEFHMDGLRLDAIHAICDLSQHTLLECLGETKRLLERRLGRAMHLIAESSLNDPHTLSSTTSGGVELDMQWNDDFHHALHALLTGERHGYYQDYGKLSDLADAYLFGTVYRDRYSSYRRRSWGRSFADVDRRRLVTYTANHDQIGNRPRGDRVLEERGMQRLAAACLFLSPFTPMLFMGDERGATEPFAYFVDHRDPELLEAVRIGRRKEFAGDWHEPPESIPDPAAPGTFDMCRITAGTPPSPGDFEYYRALIAHSKWLRRERLFEPPRVRVRCDEAARVLEVGGAGPSVGAHAVFCFDSRPARVRVPPFKKVLFHSGGALDSDGPGGGDGTVVVPPWSALLLQTDGTREGTDS